MRKGTHHSEETLEKMRGPRKPMGPQTDEHIAKRAAGLKATVRRRNEQAQLYREIKKHGHAVLDVLSHYRDILAEHGVEPFIKELPAEEADKVRAAYKQAGADGAVWSMFGAVAKKLLVKDAELLDTLSLAERYEEVLADRDARIAELEQERRLPEATIRALRQKELYRPTEDRQSEPPEDQPFTETRKERGERIDRFFSDLNKGRAKR